MKMKKILLTAVTALCLALPACGPSDEAADPVKTHIVTEELSDAKEDAVPAEAADAVREEDAAPEEDHNSDARQAGNADDSGKDNGAKAANGMGDDAEGGDPAVKEDSGTAAAGAKDKTEKTESSPVKLSDIPKYSGKAYVAVVDNIPGFTKEELVEKSFESYSKLDSLGGCGAAYACVGQDTMPTEKRGSIETIKPSGWHTVKYDGVDGKYLYNRCHLIGYQLSAENANEKNLITGTRYLNMEGMLPFENMVADYVKETGNHVLYRVTPIFKGKELVARGVQMEAMSVEDNGEGVSYNVFCYNVQPGIKIAYKTGKSSSKTAEKEKKDKKDNIEENEPQKAEYILNTNTKKFHYPSCRDVDRMSEANKQTYTGTRDEIIAQGYSPCGHCHP